MPLIIGEKKPRVILGTMTFGPDTETGARITSLDTYNKCLDTFQSRGYNEIDTARVYVGGKQEAFTREANWKSRGLTLATKVLPTEPGVHEPAELKARFNTSLKELDTDCVDIFYLHAADRTTPFERTLQACNDLHKEGKFVQLGLSNFSSYEVAEVVMICRQHNWVKPTIYQGMYNAITRNITTECFPACRRYGLDIVIYNPLAGGLFSGKVKSHDVKPAEGRFSDNAKSGDMYRQRYFKKATFDALRLIEPVAQKHNLTMLEIALRWVVHHSELKVLNGHDGVIIGVSSLEQLEGNLTDLEKGPLPEDVVTALDEAWLVSKATSPPYWQKTLEYTYDTRAALFGPQSTS